MNRRGLLRGILAAGMAPAVVGSGILMPLGKVWAPTWPSDTYKMNLRELYSGPLPEHMLVQYERAARNVLVFGTGALYIGADGVRSVEPGEMFKSPAPKFVVKADWAE